MAALNRISKFVVISLITVLLIGCVNSSKENKPEKPKNKAFVSLWLSNHNVRIDSNNNRFLDFDVVISSNDSSIYFNGATFELIFDDNFTMSTGTMYEKLTITHSKKFPKDFYDVVLFPSGANKAKLYIEQSGSSHQYRRITEDMPLFHLSAQLNSENLLDETNIKFSNFEHMADYVITIDIYKYKKVITKNAKFKLSL